LLAKRIKETAEEFLRPVAQAAQILTGREEPRLITICSRTAGSRSPCM
jgi:hypothetical protein